MPAPRVPHIMTLADLTVPQINKVITHAHYQRATSLPWLAPATRLSKDADDKKKEQPKRMPSQSLFNKSIALLFNKRSTRTRVSAETASVLLGGRALFLGREDIQLGVNETVRDSARVIGGFCQGIFARVGEQAEIDELAQYSPVPVLNALSDLWHPTQILADILTLHDHAHLFTDSPPPPPSKRINPPAPLPPLTIAWVGDSNNILHDMLVSYPRLGHKLRVATPGKEEYQCPRLVRERVEGLGIEIGKEEGKGPGQIFWTEDPREAVKGADVVVTDTWVSMGQEEQKAQRLRDFAGYQVTEALCREGGAKDNWKFMHCLPRKGEEVDDEVFYGPRSLVFPESDNRKWTIMALFDLLFGKWELHPEQLYKLEKKMASKSESTTEDSQ
ncbi:mitochondrial ornithine carbamoyltransferase [Gloeophyllum trabeum ATCC 11539]|uniref:ornithine carbamoyltransferase n=1 Tax=Gloeophyllum trabeum (strain ATCC 11539 / FP-39264 / Madison 617) TaxID=670483 RepID=S7Q0F4_GLOTA|nr:mitochondrial ornithine carbamoyltransferase [Gloeophyllum trabeum ATCC 11539]EPQ53183.1 mitochondrial ornithine carbamoyltransferase [Gloeophyllum trabeum ATCC 11539]